jgi:death-on-curing protein
MNIRFLKVSDVKYIHYAQVEHFGGMHGLRDENLLDSAVHHPQSSFGGEYLYKDIFQMAAAYTFGIVKNHPFFDGNKRTGAAAGILFLDYNGYEMPESNVFTEHILGIATNEVSQEEFAKFYRENSILLF